MLVLIKSHAESRDAKRAVKLARDMAADILLMQNAVYLAEKDRLEGFCGTVYALDEDMNLRGVKKTEKDIRAISYAELVDLMAGNDKVSGLY